MTSPNRRMGTAQRVRRGTRAGRPGGVAVSGGDPTKTAAGRKFVSVSKRMNSMAAQMGTSTSHRPS